MATHDGTTNKVHRIELPSSLEGVWWTRSVAAPGATVGLEIFTHYVGNGSELRIELMDGRGRKHGTFRQRIAGDRFWAAIQVPAAAEKALIATVELPKHGLEKTSPALLIAPAVTIRNLAWSKSEARRGDVLTLTADVKGAPDGTEAEVSIWEHDEDGAHDPVTQFTVTVDGETVEAEWEFEYVPDTDDIATEEEAADGYSRPEYFFRVDVHGVQADSDLLTFKDWIEIVLTDEDGDPIPDVSYVLHMPDGTEREGRLGVDGRAYERDIPPGPYFVAFPEMEEMDEADRGETPPPETVTPQHNGHLARIGAAAGVAGVGAPPGDDHRAQPVGVEEDEIVLQLDCSGYPTDEAPLFRMNRNPERWVVRTVGREPVRTYKLEELFLQRYDQGLEQMERELLADLLELESVDQLPATGRGMKKMIADRKTYYRKGSPSMKGVGKKSGYQINYHHLRPNWAGGEDAPYNLWPVEPGHKMAGIHQNWWARKLMRAIEEQGLEEMLLAGMSVTEKSIEDRMTEIAAQSKQRHGKRLVIEMMCPEAVST